MRFWDLTIVSASLLELELDWEHDIRWAMNRR